MTKKKKQISKTPIKDESRVLPLLIAGLFCFGIATLLGFGTWSVFGSQARERGDTARFLAKLGIQTSSDSQNQQTEQTTLEQSEKTEEPTKQAIENTEEHSETETTVEITGVVDVEGMEFAVGGGNTERPIERFIVEDFLIAETEVTNEQYAEFIKETGHRSPYGWNKAEFPKGRENYPVVHVSWSDANAFCEWLSKKYGMKVRLPKQAEWELAARGDKRFKYPWGNDWNSKAINSKKSNQAMPVKSYPLNKSPFGAYDMVGSVWEWTSEEIKKNEMESEVTKQTASKKEKIYLALGGSFNEDRNKLRNTFWAELESKKRDKTLGFRYVIIPNESTNN